MDIPTRALWTLPGGPWWRFGRYELRAGYLHPASGSRLVEYDPWEFHRALRDGRREGKAPYESLLGLLDDLDLAPASYATGRQPFALTAAGVAALTAWCAEHGLLGVLPHVAHQVTLPARWGLATLTGGKLVPARTCYVRGAFGWVAREDAFWETRSPAFERATKQPGALVPEDLLPAEWTPPGVLLQDLGEPGWRFEPLDGTWAHFFPDVPEVDRPTYPYPRPCSEPFWQLYAEPVDAFLRAAAVLRDAVTDLAQPRGDAEAGDSYLHRLWRGLEALQSLLTAITPALLPLGNGTYLQHWQGNSLLGTLAMMAYLDLTERRRVFSCARCRKIFTSAAYQARYCSERCRYAAQKRAYRGRVRARALQHGEKEGAPHV